MAGARSKDGWLAGIGLRESLFLTLCALLLVSTKVFFRLKLGIPGHSALFLAFCLVLGRLMVQRHLSATFVGLLAGLCFMALGLGKAGPLALAQTVLPGLLVDGFALLGLSRFLAGTALLGVAAGFGRWPAAFGGNLLVGMDVDLAASTAGIKLLPALLFGAVGGALAWIVARRIAAAGLTPGEE